ncbi:MAG TPA: His-Xaa-Ser system radical SAM maturase HxsC [Terriglobales bacterium]|nr:His-Xaa-Ser system radical SAM maturase HxsC [Terriglobales bacterium]
MERNVTLALHGVASKTRGFNLERPWQVIRARAIGIGPDHEADAALIKSAEDLASAASRGFQSAVIIGDIDGSLVGLQNVIWISDQYGYLSDGDLLGFLPRSRRFRTLYRRSSTHNSFLVTERCNHYCLMCSQPPRDIDDRWILDEIKAALPLVDPQTKSFAFTGGEPLLEWRTFIEILEQCRDLLPNTAVHVLTNGRAFADSTIASAWADVCHPNLMAAIPIYSAVDCVHDYVVQAKGAFHETILGILKLKDRGQRVEVRVVLHAITAPRIEQTCCWIARNLPFVDHVALMGLENTGFALANADLLWIDPIDYKDALARAVESLSLAGVRVSVYNLPRCLLSKSTWPYAVQSISDWKNGYVEACNTCVERPRCSGFFTSGRPRYSRGITPITASAAAC